MRFQVGRWVAAGPARVGDFQTADPCGRLCRGPSTRTSGDHRAELQSRRRRLAQSGHRLGLTTTTGRAAKRRNSVGAGGVEKTAAGSVGPSTRAPDDYGPGGQEKKCSRGGRGREDGGWLSRAVDSDSRRLRGGRPGEEMQSGREGSRRRRLAQSGRRLGLPKIAGRAAKKGRAPSGAGAGRAPPGAGKLA